MAEITLIAMEWLPRALLGAQLEEEGHVARGFADLNEVLAPLEIGLLAPRLIILDTSGQGLDPPTLARLRRAAGAAPLLIVSGPFDAVGLDFTALGFHHVLRRPVCIRQIVDRAEELLAQSGE